MMNRKTLKNYLKLVLNFLPRKRYFFPYSYGHEENFPKRCNFLFLEPETYNALINTMRRDCRVLESFKIMDYSLLGKRKLNASCL